MADVFTKAKRSEVMSRIRSRGNQATEVALAAFFRRHKISGWRRQRKLIVRQLTVDGGGRHSKVFPRARLAIRSRRHQKAQTGNRQARIGNPKLMGAASPRRLQVNADFVFPKLKVAVFVDGCFWHGCPRHGTQPKGNAAFWRRKIFRNQSRDKEVTRSLRKSGWRVLRIWEHELKRKNEARMLRRIRRSIRGEDGQSPPTIMPPPR